MSFPENNDSDPRREQGQLEDVEDMKQRRILESLLDAEENVREARMRAKSAPRAGLSQQQALTVYRTALENYLLLLSQKLGADEDDEELWEEQELGTVTLEPPANEEFFPDLKDSELTEEGLPRFGKAHGVHRLEPKTVHKFEGLQSILDAPSELTATWQITHNPAAGSQRHPSATQRTDIPIDILDEALRHASEYAGNHGVTLDTDAGRDFTDYQ